MRNKIFEKIPVVVPNRSGFDLSHENRGTAKVGILVPVMTREMQGHDSLSVNLGAQIQFAPFATDFYGRVKCYFEAFFVPYRIIDGNYKTLYRYALSSLQGAGTGDIDQDDVNPFFEGLRVHPLQSTSIGDYPALDASMTADPSVGLVGPGTLLDYLGCKYEKWVVTANMPTLLLNNRHRLDAYHRIYEEYYMDSRLQQHAYSQFRSFSGDISNAIYNRTMPYRGTPYNNGNKFFTDDGPLLDGVYLTGLRSRNYAKDYFTTATPDPQFGGELSVEADANGRITVSQIRVANALQQFVELHNKVGLHYDDLAFAETGIRPSDAAVDIPIFLGRQVYDVYNKSIYTQTNEDIQNGEFAPSITDSPNPFGVSGSKFANGQALGSGHLCDFTATEGGIFMVLMSVAPDASYGTGSARQWYYDSIFDLPMPHLQGIGDQPIYKGELSNRLSIVSGTQGTTYSLFNEEQVFGYTQRFAEAKFMLDETHGLLQDYQSLSAFALKRSFSSIDDIELGLDFIKVPITALNEVSAIPSVDSAGGTINPQSDFGYWFDCYFDVKLVSNLSAYSIPTLEDMKGHTEMVDNGGRRL